MKTNERKWALLIMLLIVLATAALQFYYYPKLPSQVAIHFDVHGKADNIVNKKTSLIIYLVFPSLIAIGFWGLSRLPFHMSNEWISVPNPEYWLAPERREFTLEKISMFVLLSGILTLLFFFIISYLVIIANLKGGMKLNRFFAFAIIAFIMGIVLFSVYIIKYFRNIKN